MKTVFLSISFNSKYYLSQEIETIKNVVEGMGFKILVFINEYNFSSNDEKLMMKQSCDDIKRCSILIAEVSEKAIGVGIEVGYAAALNKPIIYMRKQNADYSKTVGGIVDNKIVYDSLGHLSAQLTNMLNIIINANLC